MNETAKLADGSTGDVIRQPLIIMFQKDDGVVECRIHPPFDYTHQHYGLLVCDLVRHIAGMFGVHEDKVWYWVEKERRRPTTAVTETKAAFPTVRRQ
jgi:hypothetical protein